MKFSYRWLKDYLNVRKSLQEILDGFTMAGLEVETVQDLGALSEKIVVGKILKIEEHPDADNLSLCTVDVGQDRSLNIVCGADNMKEGDKVVTALDGAILKGEFTIKRTRIRGQVSEGMLCATDELGINEDHSGILILPDDFPVGDPLDAVIDIAITPNRGDCISLLGLARDISGYFGSRTSLPSHRVNETMDPIENYLKVTVDNKKACPRYTARYIRGVRVGESPAWLKYRLETAGVRSLNNIIDATNYVMLEFGHPIHAFDLDRVANRHIIVRSAKQGEEIEMLDGEKLALKEEDLLIADPREPIALAGIMGGYQSGISRSTINVVLECAHFDPITISRTCRRLGKQTEASFRFERNVDREAIPRVIDRVASLIQDLAGGEIVHGMLDVKNYRSQPKIIPLSVEKTNRMLGTQLGPRYIADLLVGLNFEITSSDAENISFSVPSYRNDITRDVDLIEEVARMYGYNRVRPTLPYLSSEPNTVTPLEKVEPEIKDTLYSLGFDEAISYSFNSSELAEALGAPVKQAVKIANPISADQDIMRTSLLPNFIQTIAHNLNRDVLDLSLYELGKVYEKQDEGAAEKMLLMAGMCGQKFSSWRERGKPIDFYDVKGVAVALLDVLGLQNAQIERLKDAGHYHPGRCAKYSIGNKEVCRFGELHPLITEQLELKRRIYLLEMNVSDIAEMARITKTYEEIPKFPSVTRDLAIIIDRDIPAGEVESIIRNTAGKDLETLFLFDLYKGDPVPEDKKSLGYSLTFRSRETTLKDKQVNVLMERILEELKRTTGATLR